MVRAHLCLTTEVEAGLLLAPWVRAGLADHIDHARLLVRAAVEAALAAFVIEVGLLHAILKGAVSASDIYHAFCLVLAAVQPVCIPWVVAGWILAAFRQQALPVPNVDVHHARLLVRAAGDGVRRPRVVEVGVLLASWVAAQLIHHVHHIQLLVRAAEEAALLARSVEVGPGLAVWGCAAGLHAHHGTCWPFHTVSQPSNALNSLMPRIALTNCGSTKTCLYTVIAAMETAKLEDQLTYSASLATVGHQISKGGH